MRIRHISDIDGNIEKSLVCETNEVRLEDRGYTVLVKDGAGQLIKEVEVDGQHYLEID